MKKVLVVSGVTLVIIVWLLVRSDDGEVLARSTTGPSDRDSTTTVSRAGETPRAPGSPPVVAPADEVAQRALMDAMREMQQREMPAFDGCIGPSRSRREAVAIMIRFERTADDGTTVRYAARDVVIHDPVTAAVRACIERIRGHELTLPVSTTSADPVLFQPLTLFVPGRDSLGAKQ